MVRVAVVGAGNWGRILVRNFDALESAELAYVCDLDPGVRRAMAAQYPHARVVDRYETILEDDSLDAVVVALESPLHYNAARGALEADKHTYVEKPLTLSSAEALDLVELAEARRRKLMVGHLLEYHPAVNHVKQMLCSGELGEALYLYFQRVNLGIVRKAENAWWSLAPHDISVAGYLFEAEPVSVSATGHAYLQPGVEDVVFANVKFADGRMAHIHVSWLDPHKIRKMTLVGSQKMAVFDDMQAAEKLRIYDKGASVNNVSSYADSISLRIGDILIPKISAQEPLRSECQHFIDCIEKDMTPRSDGYDGLRVVKVLEAGSRSLARGGELIPID